MTFGHGLYDFPSSLQGSFSPSFHHSKVRSVRPSILPRFVQSVLPSFQGSFSPSFHHSKVRSVRPSITPSFVEKDTKPCTQPSRARMRLPKYKVVPVKYFGDSVFVIEDQPGLKEMYDRECHSLKVTMTRDRDRFWPRFFV